MSEVQSRDALNLELLFDKPLNSPKIIKDGTPN